MSDYRSPAVVVAACRERGKRTPGELYECAIGRVPRQLNDRSAATWAREARRLAEAQGTFDGDGRSVRRRRTKAKARSRTRKG